MSVAGAEGSASLAAASLLSFFFARDLESWVAKHPIEAARGLAKTPSQGFFDWVATYLQASVGVKYAFVGEVVGEDWDKIRTVSVVCDGQSAPNFQYDLLGTPCANVIARDICVLSSDAAAQYPDDEMMVEMGIEAYVGVSLVSESGLALGLMVLLDTKPISKQVVARACANLQAFRVRLQDELVSRHALRSLELAAQGAGQSFSNIEHLLSELRRAMNLRAACVTMNTAARQSATLSLVSDGKRLDNIEFEEQGTPYARLNKEPQVLIPSGLSDAFYVPFELGFDVSSYVGVAVKDNEGATIGHVALLHDREISSSLLERPLFRVLTAQLASEVRRLSSDRQRASAEARLVEAQRRESLGLLAGGVAHDFNNLLLVISAYAEMIAEGSSKSEELAAKILTAADQAHDLCGQLLAYAGKSKPDRSVVDLCALLRLVSSLTEVLAGQACRRIYDLPDKEVNARVDSAQIQQVITNLITNAVDAIGPRMGTITVGLSVKDIGEQDLKRFLGGTLRAGRYASIRVKDDGPGMTDEVLKRVFEPFYSTKVTGHGLGLAAVQGIVASHGGGMRVESHPGLGTCFEVLLPLSSEAVTSAKEVVVEASLGSKTILVVDDNVLVSTAVCAMITADGMAAIQAGSGEEALDIFAKRGASIDAVLLDYSMAGMNGIETLKALRKLDPKVVVVLSSGYADAGDLEGLDEQPNQLLPKPFTMKALRAILHELDL